MVLTPPPCSMLKKLQYCLLGASLSGSVWVSVGQHLVIESKFIGCCKDGGAISTLRNGRPAGEQLNNQVRNGGDRSCPPSPRHWYNRGSKQLTYIPTADWPRWPEQFVHLCWVLSGNMIIRGAGQELLLGGGFLYPSFIPGQHLLDLQSKKGTHQKNHKDNPLIPACEEINWDCGAEQPMLMSFQLLWTSTAPTVFYLLITKRKEKCPISFWFL